MDAEIGRRWKALGKVSRRIVNGPALLCMWYNIFRASGISGVGGLARAYAVGFGAVASEEPLASYAGARVLELGGNAVDAAVATSFALAVLIPHLGGIGGDFFALMAEPNGSVTALNGSGYSPRRLGLELLEEKNLSAIPERGPSSIVVPGMVGGLHELWRRYGSIEWSKLLEIPARLAGDGFPAPPSLARALKAYHAVIQGDEGSKLTYPGTMPWESYKFTGLAGLLEEIAVDPRAFYEGEPAEAMVDYIQRVGGVLEVDDMKSYKPEWVEPLKTSYRGWELYEIPPNSQGATTLHILKLLEEHEAEGEPTSIGRYKQLVDIAMPCYRWRDLNLGDPRYMKHGIRELIESRVLGEIKKMRGDAWRNKGDVKGDTTFYAIADREGMVVAGIQSLFHPFGSGITEPGYQVTFNNRASGFTFERGLPNTLGPLKKPLHTLSALIMRNEKDDRIVALGASGGHYRPQLHAIFASNIIDHKLDLEESINIPRASWDWTTGRITVEKSLGWILEGAVTVERIGVANAVEVWGRFRGGATDWRGDGVPVALTS